MHSFERRGLFSLLIVAALITPLFSTREYFSARPQENPSDVGYIISSTDSWSIQDYEKAITSLFGVFDCFNLSSYGGGWQVEVWGNFSDYAWSYGKKAYFDAQCIIGLVEAYRLTKNMTYLRYAEDIWTWDRGHFWDATYGGYYERLSQDNSVEVGNKRLCWQCLIGVALVRLYTAAGNSSYLNYAEDLVSFIIENYYNSTYGSYYTTLSSTLSVIEGVNDINDICWCARFMLELYNVTHDETLRAQAVGLINNFLTHMYDNTYGWFYNRVAENWTTVIKDSKGWYDNYRMLIDAYRIIGNNTYLEFAQKTFDDIEHANSSAGYLMEMNREWTSTTMDAVVGEKDPNTAIGYLWTGTIVANSTILNEAFRFKDAIYKGLLDTTYGGMYMRRYASGDIDTWKQWLEQGLVLEMLSTFAEFLTFPDRIAPRIESTHHEPTSPFDTDMVTVRTHIRDMSGVSWANVSFEVNDGEWTNSSFKHLQGDLFEYTFNSLHAGDTVDYYVIAADGSVDRNIAVDDNSGILYSFYVRSNDWTGPGISSVAQYPSKPTVDDAVEINATVRDLSGVYSVILHHKTNAGNWQGLPMEHIGSDVFHAELSGFNAGDSVHYYISALDNSLNHNSAVNDNLGAYYHFTVAPRDISPPTIQSISWEPEQPTAGSSTIIRANITDQIEVASVILSYTINSNQDWKNVTMSNNQGIWIVVLPAFENPSTVSFKVTAYDRSGNYVVSDIQSFVVGLPSEQQQMIIFVSAIATITASLVIIIGMAVIVKEVRARRDYG
jgi:hypothetical protein